MTAAIAISAPKAPTGLVTPTTVVAAAAVGVTLAGVVFAPAAVLIVAVLALVFMGMATVGRQVDRTFESLVALAS